MYNQSIFSIKINLNMQILALYPQDAPATAKQFYGETPTASVVEILSREEEEDDLSLEEASSKSTALLSSSSDTSCSSSVGREGGGLETDYVALNKNTVVVNCTKENSYVDEDLIHKTERGAKPKKNVEQQSGGHSGSDFSNHSYLFMSAESVDKKDRDKRGQGNVYTNMPQN